MKISKHSPLLWYLCIVAVVVLALILTGIAFTIPFSVPMVIGIAGAILGYYLYTKKPKEKEIKIEEKEEEKEIAVPKPPTSFQAEGKKLSPVMKSVIFDNEVMELIFYKAAKFKHEVGGILIGGLRGDDVIVKKTYEGFEIDFRKIHLAGGEKIVGFWHSHPAEMGIFFSSADKQQLEMYPNYISVVVSSSAKGEAIAAYIIADGKIVKLPVSQETLDVKGGNFG